MFIRISRLGVTFLTSDVRVFDELHLIQQLLHRALQLLGVRCQRAEFGVCSCSCVFQLDQLLLGAVQHLAQAAHKITGERTRGVTFIITLDKQFQGPLSFPSTL